MLTPTLYTLSFQLHLGQQTRPGLISYRSCTPAGLIEGFAGDAAPDLSQCATDAERVAKVTICSSCEFRLREPIATCEIFGLLTTGFGGRHGRLLFKNRGRVQGRVGLSLRRRAGLAPDSPLRLQARELSWLAAAARAAGRLRWARRCPARRVRRRVPPCSRRSNCCRWCRTGMLPTRCRVPSMRASSSVADR